MAEGKEREAVFRTIIEEAEKLAPYLTDTRRDLHRYAEGGFREYRTSSLIARRLRDLGYEVLTGDAVMKKEARMSVPSEEESEREMARAIAQGADPEYAETMKGGMTGVIGILRAGEGPVVGLRFDIDALGITESCDEDHVPQKCGFRSVNDGYMHACGHDAHAAIGLGTAEVLMKIRDHLTGTIKLVFQPAEESVRGGARSIVENGHFDDVMYMVGSHVTDARRSEAGDLYPGQDGSLATSKWDAVIHGKAAHAGGSPQKGNDALLAFANIVLNLNAIPRHADGATRIGIGKVRDDSVINSISDEVRFSYEVRGETTPLCTYMQEKAENVIRSAAEMYGCTYTLQQTGEAQSFTSSPSMMRRVRRVCTEDLGMAVTPSDALPGKGSEDVSYMVNKTQENGGEATFLRLLTMEKDVAHGRRFDIDEAVLPKGVKAFSGLVYDICAKQE